MTPPTKFNREQSATIRELLLRYRNLYLSSENHGARPRAPHPGDVLYWVGAVGATAAILFVATR